MRIEFETEFTIDLPGEKGVALTKLLEGFVNDISKIMPMPRLRVGVSESTQKGIDDADLQGDV